MDATTAAGVAPGRAGWKTFGDAVSRRLWPLQSEALCAAARQRTGLEDFGDPPLEPALSVLVKSLEEEADLHPLGRFLMRAHLRGLLETRLRLVETWSRQLEALEAAPLPRPVFITGMPRSGSTFLHELLATDPDNRAPLVWEVMFPVPEARRSSHGPRVRKADACLWWFRRLAPQADTVYPMRACTPHECVAIHSYTMLSEEFVSTCRIPTYERFLHSADLGPTYRWERSFLQHLQSGCPTKRWVLKSPDHVQSLEALFSIFPDAVVIQTHRNPLEVVKSSSHLTQVLQGLYARPVDRDQIALREAQALGERMERFLRFREAHPELAGRFADVEYPELVATPMVVVRRIYEQLQMTLTEAAAEGMRHLAENRSRYQRPRAGATLADWGLDAAAEARRFERYCSRFGIPCR